MATREIQIDGVTGNPIGGSIVGSNSQVGGNVVQDSYRVASSALNQGGYTTTTTTGYGAGSQGYAYTSSAPAYNATQSYTTTQYVQQPATYTTGQSYTTQYVSAPVATTTAYTAASQAPQVVNTVVNTGKEVIKGESRI